MTTRKQNQHDKKAPRTEELDSPTILNLIEELDNDLVETKLKVPRRN
jgi:hypothetical protein